MTIRRDDRVREDFASCSSNNALHCYYETKGHALCAFDAALAAHGYALDHVDNSAWSGNEGQALVDILTDQGEVAGQARFHYYRMPSGRYEFVGYIT